MSLAYKSTARTQRNRIIETINRHIRDLYIIFIKVKLQILDREKVMNLISKLSNKIFARFFYILKSKCLIYFNDIS